MSYIIAISNEKGGVAKTTTALSLGAALAENGHRVLLIDLDPQANLTLALGLEPSGVARTSANLLIEAASLESVRRSTDLPNVDLVPSGSAIESAEQFLPVRTNYYATLKNILAMAAPLPYQYVIMDCPPALGAITSVALTAARLLVIPTQAEFFSAYALRDMMGMVRRIRAASNPTLSYRILVTMFNARSRSHRSILEQLKATFGTGLFETLIEMDTKLRESPIAGQPITQYKPNSRGAQQYRLLTQELIAYAEETNKQTA